MNSGPCNSVNYLGHSKNVSWWWWWWWSASLEHWRSCVYVFKILDLLIQVFNKGGDAKLDVAISADRTPELTRMSPYVTNMLILVLVPIICLWFHIFWNWHISFFTILVFVHIIVMEYRFLQMITERWNRFLMLVFGQKTVCKVCSERHQSVMFVC